MTTDYSLPPIHTTDRQAFKSCRLRWDFTSNLRRNLQPEKHVNWLTFGTAWHAGLEAYYDPKYDSRDIARAKEAFLLNLQTSFYKNESPSVEDQEEYEDNKALGIGMLEGYLTFAKANDRFNVLWVEEAFLVPIEGVANPYSLKPDMVVEDFQNKVWIWENKSADKLPENTEYLLMDEQVGGYMLGILKAKGIACAGTIYNIARKKLPSPIKVLQNGNLSKDKRITTTYERAKAQVLDHYGEIPADFNPFLEHLQGQRNPFFYREAVRRNRRELAFLDKMITVESKEMLDPDVLIYRNPNRFNCSGCAFVGPCLTYYEGGDVETILEANYVPRVVE